MKKHSLRSVFLISVGILSLALGTVGIGVPLLPTTPLLLLAAACFVRSSDRLYRWFIGNRLFGSYVRNYRDHKSVTWQMKAFTLILLWFTIAYSVILVVGSLVVRTTLLAIAFAVSVHVLNLKTLSRRPGSERPDRKPHEG